MVVLLGEGGVLCVGKWGSRWGKGDSEGSEAVLKSGSKPVL